MAASGDTISDSPQFDFDPDTGTIMRKKSTKTLPPSGSVRSTKSLGGISIFVDPDAGAAMPRDEEITFNMYEKASISSGGAPSAQSVPIEHQNGSASAYTSERSSAINDSDVSSFMAGEHDQRLDKLKHEDYSFTFSPSLVSETVSAAHLKRSSSDSQSQAHRASSLAVAAVKKPRAGSFQFKSAYGLSQLPARDDRRGSAHSNRSSHIGSDVSNHRASREVKTVSKRTTRTSQSDGGEEAVLTNGFDTMGSESRVTTTTTTIEVSKVSTPSHSITHDTHIEGSGGALVTNGMDTLNSKVGQTEVLTNGDDFNLQSKESGGEMQTNGFDTLQSDITTVTSILTTSSNEMTAEPGTSYQNEATVEEVDVHQPILGDGKSSGYKRMESDLTSVSSLESGALIDSWDNRKSSRPVSRSESQKSARSLSKAPSLTSINEKQAIVVTDIEIEDSDLNKGPGSFNFQNLYGVDVGSLERKALKSESERSYSSAAPRRKRTATKTDSMSSAVSSSYKREDSPKPDMTRSESQGSIVQNLEFRNKMASLMSGGVKSSKPASSVSSSASSTMTRRKREPVYRSDVHLDISSESASTDKVTQRKDSSSYEIHSSTFPRDSQSDKPIKSDIRSATHELKDTIKTGTVGTLIKDKFKNLNLTGRSLSQSALVVSASQSEADPTETQKFKFVVEGIDTPAAEDTVTIETRGPEVTLADQDRGAISDEDQDKDESSLTRRKEFTKGGFSYVRDELLTSQILKRASDVTARKPHETLERKPDDDDVVKDEHTALIEAKSKLRHDLQKEEKPHAGPADVRSAMLQQIRSRLVSPTFDKPSTSYTTESTTTTSNTHVTEGEGGLAYLSRNTASPYVYTSPIRSQTMEDRDEAFRSHVTSPDADTLQTSTSVEVHSSSGPRVRSFREDESVEVFNEKIDHEHSPKSQHTTDTESEARYVITATTSDNISLDRPDSRVQSAAFTTNQSFREDESVQFSNDTLEFRKSPDSSVQSAAFTTTQSFREDESVPFSNDTLEFRKSPHSRVQSAALTTTQTFREDESVPFSNDTLEYRKSRDSRVQSAAFTTNQSFREDESVPFSNDTLEFRKSPDLRVQSAALTTTQTFREDESVPFTNDTSEYRKSPDSHHTSEDEAGVKYVIATSTSHDESRDRRDTDRTGYEEATHFTEVATITTDTNDTKYEPPTKTIFEMNLPIETKPSGVHTTDSYVNTTDDYMTTDRHVTRDSYVIPDNDMTTDNHVITDSHVTADSHVINDSHFSTDRHVTADAHVTSDVSPENAEETVITSSNIDFTEERFEIEEEVPEPPPLPDRPPPITITSDDMQENQYITVMDDSVSLSSSSSDGDHKQINELHLSQQKLVYDGSSYEFKDQEASDRQTPIETDRLSNVYHSSQQMVTEEKVVPQVHDRAKRRSEDLADRMSSSILATSLRDVNRSSYTTPQHIDPPSYENLSVASEPPENYTAIERHSNAHHYIVEPVPKTTVQREAINSYDSASRTTREHTHTFKDDSPTQGQSAVKSTTVHTKRGAGQGHISRRDRHERAGDSVSSDSTVKGSDTVAQGRGELYIELSGNTPHTHAREYNRGDHSFRSYSSSGLSSPRDQLQGNKTRIRIETVNTGNLPPPRNYYEPKYIDIPVIDVVSEPESPRSGLLLVKQARSPPVSPHYRSSSSHHRRSRRDQPRYTANPRYRALSNPPNPRGEYKWHRQPVYRSNSSSTIGSTQSVPVHHSNRDPYVVDKHSGHHVRYRVTPRSPHRSPVRSPRSPIRSPRSPFPISPRSPPRSGRSKTVVQLSPVNVHGRLSTHLSAHPSRYHSSSGSSIMTSPGVMSDIEVFDTSNMNGVSTMGRRVVLDNSYPTKDENMNYKKSRSERIITVDESRGGRVPIGNRGMRISTINIEGDDSFDAHSTVSDPTLARKHRVKNIMERRTMPTRPANMNVHSDTHIEKQKYFSMSREPTVQIKKTEEVELDPHLDEAHKTGDKYNVSLKLNANVINSNETSVANMLQQEYVEENLYTSRDHRGTGQAALISPRDTHSSVSSGSTLHSPLANRSKTNITFYDDENTGTLRAQQANTVDHLRFKQYVDKPPQILTSQSGYYSDRGGNDKYVIKSNIGGTTNDNSKMRYHSNSSNGGGAEPKFSMSIDQTMTMDYVPTDDQPHEPKLQPQKAPKNKHRRVKQPRDERMDYRIVNGDVGRPRRYTVEEDLEQYLSPAEDHDYESDEDLPHVVRGSILIQNAIDTTSAPKVIDVVEGDSGSEPDVTDNVNPFHGHYLQSRENPMYSSDPDLARLARQTAHKQHSKQKPEFVKLFEEPKKKQVNGAFAELERQRYDTEIKVTRGNSHSTKSPRRQASESHRSESYVYNGYDLPQRSNHVSSSSSSRLQQRASSSGGGGGGGGGHMRSSGGGGYGSGHQRSSESRTEFEISRLLQDAPPDSIRQTINVEREEEEIIGPLPEGSENVESMLNFDTISEKVELGMKDGTAQVSVKVRCERIVPILGVSDMFKKSSVIVTRLIEIDLLITDERRRLYDHITRRASGKQMITENGERRQIHSHGRLSNKETFKLYKTFMGMAEADEAGRGRDNIRIDRRVEEQSRPEVEADGMDLDLDLADGDDLGFNTDDLDKRLEDQMIQYAMRPPEPDTISFMSALSETEGMMY